MRLCTRIEKFWTRPLVLVGVATAIWVVCGAATVHAGPVDDSLRGVQPTQVKLSMKNVPPVDYKDGKGERVSVLVEFAPVVRRGVRQRTSVQAFCQKHGAYQKYSYGKVLPNVVNIRDLPLSQLAALRKMPGVVRVERDRMVHAYMDDSTPLIRALQSQIAAAGLTANGSNVRVCVIDTGIDSDNQMYASRIDTAAGKDFVNGDNNPEDDNGHGSHVSGTVLGGTGISRTVCGVSKPFQGVAPNATLIGVKVLDSTGNGTFSNVIAGINYCADQTAGGGRADVISMSLGGGQFASTCDSDSGAAAANNAVSAGVVVIASSGNDGFSNSMGTPACGSSVISVGATYDADFPNCANSTATWNWGICSDTNPTVDSIVCFSNKSDFLDVVAPGCNTTSASNAAGGTSFTAMCGTSMAAPHVAGLAALILSADPNLTPAEVRQIIRDGSIDLGATGFDRVFGYGRIDAINSLQLVGPGCAVNADCNDNDPCTTDTCSGGVCSFTPISCPGGQTCIGGTCQGQGACCTGLSCAIDNPTDCSASGGSYLGDGSVCGSGTAGNPTVYQNAPGAAIPDGGGAGNPATDTINVPDTFTMGDVNVDLDISHTWVGDLTVTVSHLGTTVTIVDRPGVPSSTYGCSNNNFVGILLDDEGTGGTMESQCAQNLTSPPNYTPNSPLSAFDGMDAAGLWTITVYDSVSADSGTLNSWSLHIDAVGSNPCSGCTTNAQCDDGVFCNGAETCVAGACQAGTAVNCNDGIGCTTDSCNEGTASCDNVASNAACDDGLFCNGAETCDPALDCQAGTAVNCNDGVGCTTDSCNEGTNSCDNTPSNAACDDGIFCNGAETCDAALDCQAGSNPCPGLICNEATAVCVACNVNADCDDGVFCNGAETCAGNVCQAGTTVTCNDGVGCTDDACNEATKGCDNIANNANCDNGLYCDGTETCDAVLDCQAGTAVNCNDGVGCTMDSCNEATNSCDNTPNNTFCDDGVFCNGAETCDAILDCQAGTAVNCNDGVGCTTDSCNEAANACDNIASNAACDDGLFCNGVETCDPALDCQAGTAVNCNDGVGCTVDSCNEATASCDNVASNAACDDGLFCNGTETCSATLDCQAGANPCPGQACDEPTNTCVACVANADCDDGLFCNGAETCVNNACVAGNAVNCNDGVGCTADSCNEATASCDNVASNAACDDGIFCNGAETCDPALDCQAGTAVDCNDGVGCTADSCNEATASCDNVASNAACDDGLYCNGSETCDALLDCQAGTAVVCNDGVGCTNDSCNEATASCDFIASDANCDNGLFCDGTETCDPVNDCQVGTAVNCNDGVGCTADSCNEATASCDNVPNNAGCDDGLFCNGAEICDTLLDCLAGTPVNCADGVGCTVDSCNEATSSCDNVPNNAACGDGLFCNGAETCDPALDCQPGGNPCPGQSCDEATASCVACLVNADCDDGLFCNGTETCVGNVCQAGTTVNCGDGVACTTDSCNEATNSCDNVPSNGACDDGLYCNGTETCDALLDCQAGTAVNCNDGVACTADSCNEATNACDNVPNNASCDDGLFCNGPEICDISLGCLAGTAPCTAGQTCDEATSTCNTTGPPPGEGFLLSKNADFSTDDRTFTLADTMYMMIWTDVVDFNNINRSRWELKDANKNKVRQPMTNNFDGSYTASFALSGLPSNATSWTWKGEAKDNAGNSFKPTATITIVTAPACSVNADCSDGDPCTTDVCSGGVCSNTPINCDDGNACTADSCSGGTCVNAAISCDDGNACTIDSCDLVAGCANTPVNCDDGNACTADSCSAGTCVNTPLAVCCGDGTCDVGEDSCGCAADCGAPPATETSCTDGFDNDCDGNTDCADTDCNGDPACSVPTGEGFILSLNPDFSTDDRTFTRADTMYMKIWSDVVNFNDINRSQWELKDANKNKIRQPMTNNFDGTYTASFALSGLPSNDTSWTWKGEAKDNAGNRYKPSVTVTVLP